MRYAVLLVCLVLASLRAAAEDTLAERVRALAERHLETLIHHPRERRANPLQAPGGIIAVYIGGKQFFHAAGRIDPHGNPPTKDTVFGLGSVTKTFTTSILGQHPELFTQAITAGALPPGFDLQPAEQAATFEQLATFTAGIPSAPDFCSGITQPVCTQAQFIEFINSVTPKDGTLPAPNEYSDSSVGFLAQILMFRDGFQDFGPEATEEWLNRNLFSHLGMKNTHTRPVHDAAHPLSAAYNYCSDSGYSHVAHAPWVPWGAAGRAYSTAADMMRFVQAYVGERTIDGKEVPERVLAGMRRAVEPRAPMTKSSVLRQGFAWVVSPEELPVKSRISGKAGGINGVSSYVAVNPDLGYGVVTLTNLHYAPAEEATMALMNELREVAVELRK